MLTFMVASFASFYVHYVSGEDFGAAVSKEFARIEQKANRDHKVVKIIAITPYEHLWEGFNGPYSLPGVLVTYEVTEPKNEDS